MRNIKTKKKLRIMAMMVVLFLPIAATAQGGLFQRGDEPTGYRGDGAASLTNQAFGNPFDGSVVTNQTFGAPLGSGLIFLLMASTGYAVSKSNKRNNKSKKENIK